jgi:two-component system chemotaxis response regulator CheB
MEREESMIKTFAPRHGIDVVLLAASAGGVQATQKLLSALPQNFPAPIVVVQHRTTHLPNVLAKVLGYKTALEVKPVAAGETLRAGTVYVAPPDRHVTITAGRRLALSDGKRVSHVLSSADPLFCSAAQSFGSGVVAVVLTGTATDAAAGSRAVKDAGGTVIVQDRATSLSFQMPQAAINTGAVDEVLPLEAIAPELVRLTA